MGPFGNPRLRTALALVAGGIRNMDSTIETVAGLYRRVLARNTEAKPDAADRMNQRIGLLIVYLAAHSPDIDINDVERRIEMNIPYMLEKRGARHDPAFVADQIF